MTEIKLAFAHLSPFFCAAVTEHLNGYQPSQTGADILQYGALGLCALMVGWLFFKDYKKMKEDAITEKDRAAQQKAIYESHLKERQELVSSIRQELATRERMLNSMFNICNRICSTLHERPCLIKSAAFDPEKKDSICELNINEKQENSERNQ